MLPSTLNLLPLFTIHCSLSSTFVLEIQPFNRFPYIGSFCVNEGDNCKQVNNRFEGLFVIPAIPAVNSAFQP
jgi:hypothetical protein